MKSTRALFFACLLIWGALPILGLAQENGQSTQTPASSKDLYSMDLDAILNMKVTTASKSSEKLSDAPGMITVVTRDELNRFGGTTLRDILERVPGLIGSTTYMTDRSTIASRGDQVKGNGAHVLYLINGRPTREIQEGGLSSDLLQAFPVAALERIEVIKGPGSVLYGSDAFSAVINLITQKAEVDSVVVTGLAGEKGAFGTSGTATFRRGSLSIIGAARYHEKPTWETAYGYRSPATGQVAVQGITIPDQGTGTYVGLDYKGLRVQSAFTEWDNASYVRGAVGPNETKRAFTDVGYGLKIKDRWNMDFNLTHTHTWFSTQNSPFVRRSSNDLVLEWTNNLSVAESTHLTFGSLYEYMEGTEKAVNTTPAVVSTDASRSNGAFYAQMDHRLIDSVKLIGGFQAIKVENIDLKLVPRAGIIWSVTKRFNLKALYSQAYRAPSINEIGLNHPNGSRGNPSLVPENVTTFDAGVTYQGTKYQVGVSYFNSRQTGIIVWNAPVPPRQYSNLGSVRFHGVESEGKYYISKSVLLLGSMLYQTNKDQNGKLNTTPIANFGAKGGISYEGENGLTVGLFDVYQGHLNGYNTSVNPKPGAYSLLNLYSRFDITKAFGSNAKQGLAFIVNVDNLLDKQIWSPDWSGVLGGTIPVNQGRTIYFGLEVAFGRK